MTENDIRELLRKGVVKAGGVSAWARNNSVGIQYANDVYNARKPPGPKIIAALGYEKVVTYRKVKK